MALDAARGMLYLHSFQPPLIHRDLKSHNILVTEDWSLKICDFGVARVRAESRNMTGLQGTCAWMAPEVFQSGLYSELADVFSFGIIMYEIISRKIVYPHLKFASEIGIKVCESERASEQEREREREREREMGFDRCQSIRIAQPNTSDLCHASTACCTRLYTRICVPRYLQTVVPSGPNS
jgi:serine/threonine protein kinase